MSVDIVFRIAAVGILTAVLHQVLTKSGREEMAMMTTLAGLIVVLFMVVNLIATLFQNVRNVFQFQ
jgi:stage III sporulation protein AC